MKRDIRINSLITMGILLIVQAHSACNFTQKIFVLRMFDVPLITFLMGI